MLASERIRTDLHRKTVLRSGKRLQRETVVCGGTIRPIENLYETGRFTAQEYPWDHRIFVTGRCIDDLEIPTLEEWGAAVMSMIYIRI
jgi:hypothetical protein